MHSASTQKTMDPKPINPKTSSSTNFEVPEYLESLTSQVPAIHLLMRMGYKLLLPAEADTLRGGRRSEVILEPILREWLRKNASFEAGGRRRPFSESSIDKAIAKLIKIDDGAGLASANEKKYAQLRYAPSQEENVDGIKRSHPLNLVDFDHFEKNEFHVVPEFSVARTGSTETCRLDIVLFVNGIPFGVIECKRAGKNDPLHEAIDQLGKYQKPDHIPNLFVFAQLLGAICGTAAKYGNTQLPEEFWPVWTKEEDKAIGQMITDALAKPLTDEEANKLMPALIESGRSSKNKRRRQGYSSPKRSTNPSEQDRMLASIFSPARLIEIVRDFTVFDGGLRKTARHQQYFCVKGTIHNIETALQGNQPLEAQGGIVYHTQGSGKTITAVMLAQQLIERVTGARIVLVTDRIDLDDQIYGNFRNAGITLHKAVTGRDLVHNLTDLSTRVITTLVHKFMTAVNEKLSGPLPERIFVLVDEAHRSQFGELAARMRQFFGKACFIGFTGTPISREGRDVYKIFGPRLHTYTIKDATHDGAVVPLLYEGRMIPQDVDDEAIDRWFERYTKNLTKKQAADLRRKFAQLSQLHQSRPRLRVMAFDIVTHFKSSFAGTGLKGQIVVESRADAISLLREIEALGEARAVVVMSEPDPKALENEKVREWWEEQMAKYRKPDEYEKATIKAFKESNDVDLVIVVDKLLVGFDAPRNAVLYIAKSLKDHGLLQAIARVNRLSPGKTSGLIVDYQGVLKPLTEAMKEFTSLGSESFESSDLEGTLQTIDEVVEELTSARKACLDFFDKIDINDQEAVEMSFEDEDRRIEFYEAIRDYAAPLHTALSSSEYLMRTDENEIREFKKLLKYLVNLRTSLQRRYAEKVDFGEYEPKIRKLLDEYIEAKDVEIVVPEFSLFERDLFSEEIDKIADPVSKAYAIANRIKKTITEDMDEDEYLFQQFSEMVRTVIKDYEEKRLSDAQFLKKMQGLVEQVRSRNSDEKLPDLLQGKGVARAYWGRVKLDTEEKVSDDIAAELAVAADDIIEGHRIVNWVRNQNVVNQMVLDVGDSVYDTCKAKGVVVSLDLAEKIARGIVDIAKEQRA